MWIETKNNAMLIPTKDRISIKDRHHRTEATDTVRCSSSKWAGDAVVALKRFGWRWQACRSVRRKQAHGWDFRIEGRCVCDQIASLPPSEVDFGCIDALNSVPSGLLEGACRWAATAPWPTAANEVQGTTPGPSVDCRSVLQYSTPPAWHLVWNLNRWLVSFFHHIQRLLTSSFSSCNSKFAGFLASIFYYCFFHYLVFQISETSQSFRPDWIISCWSCNVWYWWLGYI